MFAKQVELELPCTLTEQEIASRSMMLVETVDTKITTRAAQVQRSKEFRELLIGLEEKQRELSRVIRTGIEQRMVRCVVQFHMPVEATKRVIRQDTGEIVREEAMTADECQLHLFGSQLEFERFMRAQQGDSPSAPKPDEDPGEAEEGGAK